MALLMNVNQLVDVARAAGIPLDNVREEPGNLYVMVDGEDNCLYVGKAASEKRHAEEDGFRNWDHERNIYSGFIALVRENNAQRRRFSYRSEAFEPDKLLTHIAAERWSGRAIDSVSARLESGLPPSASEVEQILVRLHVRTGRLIGNSQFASQWEGPIGTFVDTVAVLAAYAAKVSGALPPMVSIAIEGVAAEKDPHDELL